MRGMQRVFTCKLRQVKGNKGEGREEMCSQRNWRFQRRGERLGGNWKGNQRDFPLLLFLQVKEGKVMEGKKMYKVRRKYPHEGKERKTLRLRKPDRQRYRGRNRQTHTGGKYLSPGD